LDTVPLVATLLPRVNSLTRISDEIGLMASHDHRHPSDEFEHAGPDMFQNRLRAALMGLGSIFDITGVSTLRGLDNALKTSGRSALMHDADRLARDGHRVQQRLDFRHDESVRSFSLWELDDLQAGGVPRQVEVSLCPYKGTRRQRKLYNYETDLAVFNSDG